MRKKKGSKGSRQKEDAVAKGRQEEWEEYRSLNWIQSPSI